MSKIKEVIRNSGVAQYQIADYLNIHEATLSKRLRKEVSADFERQILLAITAIKMERRGK